MTCSANCLVNPGDVDKINWKCIECKTDLKDAFTKVQAEKAAKAEARLAEAAANRTGLSDSEIEDRRSMA